MSNLWTGTAAYSARSQAVDAVVNALKGAAESRGKLFFDLVDFQVEINSAGDLAVYEKLLGQTTA